MLIQKDIRMAILKKGSKGSPVKEVQTQVNKLGIKPALEVDGIFGPLTDAGVRSAQKKLKLKVDGVAGEITQAALKYGKPLPTMDVIDFKGFAEASGARTKYFGDFVQAFLRISAAIDAMDVMSDKHGKAVKTGLDSVKGPIDEYAKTAAELYRLQGEFEKVLLKNPALAEKHAQQCVVLEKKFDQIWKGFLPKMQKVGDGCDELLTGAQEFAKLVKKEEATMAKINDEWFSKR